jgi:hypothetical protein
VPTLPSGIILDFADGVDALQKPETMVRRIAVFVGFYPIFKNKTVDNYHILRGYAKKIFARPAVLALLIAHS